MTWASAIGRWACFSLSSCTHCIHDCWGAMHVIGDSVFICLQYLGYGSAFDVHCFLSIVCVVRVYARAFTQKRQWTDFTYHIIKMYISFEPPTPRHIREEGIEGIEGYMQRQTRHALVTNEHSLLSIYFYSTWLLCNLKNGWKQNGNHIIARCT